MAKKLIVPVKPTEVLNGVASNVDSSSEIASPLPEYGLVGDIVFDPPLTLEEKRRIYGLGKSMEERLEEARRQIAQGDDGF